MAVVRSNRYIHRIQKYEFAQPKYDSEKPKYAKLWATLPKITIIGRFQVTAITIAPSFENMTPLGTALFSLWFCTFS